MANYANLKATINANIKANGTEAITGPVLNSVLTAAVNTLGAGYQFMGVATTSTNPGTPDANVFYIAATPGTYTNFGGKTVADGEVAILKYNGTWTKEVTGAATAAQVTQLGQEVDWIRGDEIMWSRGSYNVNTGAITASTTTLYSPIMYFPDGIVFSANGMMKTAALEYLADGTFVSVKRPFTDGTYYSFPSGAYYRVFLRNKDATTLTDVSELPDFLIGYEDKRERPVVQVEKIAPNLSGSMLSNLGERFSNKTEIRQLYGNGATRKVDMDATKVILSCEDMLYRPDWKPYRNIIDIRDFAGNLSKSKAQAGELFYNTQNGTLNKVYINSGNRQSFEIPMVKGVMYRCDGYFYTFDGTGLVNEDKGDFIKPLPTRDVTTESTGTGLTMGSFGSDGNWYPSNTITCHTDYLYYDKYVKLSFPDGINAMVIYFNDDQSSWISSKSPAQFKWHKYVVIEPGYNVVVFFRYADSRTITDELMATLFGSISATGYKELVRPSTIMGYWVAPKMESRESAIGVTTYSQLVSLYSSLVGNNSDYLTMSDVMADSSGSYQIKKIVASPKHYEKTIMIITGVHGNEYESIWSMYNFLSLLCDNSLEWKELTEIREKIRLIIIPVASPYSFVQNQRDNYNGIDPNWNYDVFWGITGRQWAGSAPFSEAEALAVKTVFDEYSDICFVYDWHTDPYDGVGNFITTEKAVPNYDLSEDTIEEEKRRLDYMALGSRTAAVGANSRSSSYNYFPVVRGVPAAIVEFSNNQISPVQCDSVEMTWALQWFINVLIEQLKELPYSIEYKLEEYLSTDSEIFNEAFGKKIPVKNLVYANGQETAFSANKFSLFLHGTFAQSATLATLGSTNISIVVADGKYTLYVGATSISNPLMVAGRESTIEIVQDNDKIDIYIDCHSISTISKIGNFSTITANVEAYLYDDCLTKENIYFVYKGISL